MFEVKNCIFEVKMTYLRSKLYICGQSGPFELKPDISKIKISSLRSKWHFWGRNNIWRHTCRKTGTASAGSPWVVGWFLTGQLRARWRPETCTRLRPEMPPQGNLRVKKKSILFGAFAVRSRYTTTFRLVFDRLADAKMTPRDAHGVI